MRKCLRFLICGVLLSTSIGTISPTSASTIKTLITCTDLDSRKTIALKANEKNCKPFFATSIWHIEQAGNSAHSGGDYANLRICTSKSPRFNYQQIRDKCAKHQITNDYWRVETSTVTPKITTANARGYDGAVFAFTTVNQNVDAPIAYYLITNLKTGEQSKSAPNNRGEISVSNLSPLTSYTFTVAAVSVDGISPASSITPVITTGAVPVVTVAPTVAAPAFTISSIAETKTANNALTGYAITSTGGAIASYAISPAAPAGTNFNTTTGLLSGTPTTAQSATAYAITATNASGSATQTFTLTVTEVVYTVGQRGPGGGIVFYVSAGYFTSAGSTCNTTCKYLEVAPATWQSETGSVENDRTYQWASIFPPRTGQDTVTAGSESLFSQEKFNWKIGQGFYNTSIMKPSGATSAAQAAVLAYAGGSVAGQWFIPSMNELNELCKYARGQTTGVLTTRCNGTGTLKVGTADDLGGFMNAYWSSSESNSGANVWYQDFSTSPGNPSGQIANGRTSGSTQYIRPIRAF
jgi:hypothetical protein